MATREDVLATILHIFSSSTNISPLALSDDGSAHFYFSSNCARSNKNECNDDEHLVRRRPSQLEDGDMQRRAIGIDQILKKLTGEESKDSSAVDKVMGVMVDFSREPSVFRDSFKEYDDNLIWEAGLKLIYQVISDQKYDTLDDEPISPHIVLNTVMDSYYHRDSDQHFDEMYGSDRLFAFDRQPNDGIKERQLSTTLAMFYLRSLIAGFAVEKASVLTRQSIASSSTTTIRWRRLHSMVDDISSLFRKMLSDQLNAVLAQESDPLKKAVETMQLITMATSVYVRNMFQACTNLIELLLKNACKESLDQPFKRRVLATSDDCIGTLSSLVALQFISGEGVEASSSSLHMVMDCIDAQHTDNLFQLMLHECDSGTHVDRPKRQKFNLWHHFSVKKCVRGSDLMQDLLLYPSTRLSYGIQRSRITFDENDDDIDDSSGDENHQETYDLLGIATIAYCMLSGKCQKSLPSPYSKEYSWNLFFPHIGALITGLKSSSTLKFMNDNQLSTRDHLNDMKAIELGLEMLEKLILIAPSTIGPYFRTRNPQKEDCAIRCCAMTLEATIESLLSLILQLSMFESAACDGSNAEVLKYSSQKVMGMSQTMLGLYMPDLRIRALASLSRKMKSTEQSKVLLPRVLDWMRPAVMKIYAKKVSSSDDISVILATIDALSPFLQDIEFAFDNPNSTFPRDLSEFMSMTEVNTSFVSIYRFIRLWVNQTRTISKKRSTTSHAAMDNFHQIEEWVLKCAIVLKSFTKSLSRLLAFWSDEGSPKDTTQFDKEDPPSGWHRLFLLLYCLKDSCDEEIRD